MRPGVLYVIACAAPPAAEVAELARLAQDRGWDVCVLTSPLGRRFADVGGLERMTGHPVRSEYKNPGEPDVLPPPDAIIAAPATVNTMNKWAAGICDTLVLGILVEAIGKRLPIVAVPSTSREHAAHPALAESIARLRSWGVTVLDDPQLYPSGEPGDESGHGEGFPWRAALTAIRNAADAREGTAAAPGAVPAAASGTWQLGDLTVNRLGFGALRLVGSGAFGRIGPSDRAQAMSVLRRAVELGVNHIDTAAFYFSALRSANELINSALAPYPDGLVIAAKVGPGRDASGEWLPWATPQQLRGQVEENLRQLGRDFLDLVYLRVYPDRPIAGHVAALAELRETGLIRHLGISAITPAQLAEAQAIAPIVSVQNRYGIGLRDAGTDELLRACGDQGIAFVPYFAVAGQGREAGPGAAEHAEVLAVARAHEATPAQVRLAWSLQKGPHVLAIPGTGNPGHLMENVTAAALRLSPGELARLDAIGGRG